MIFFDIETVSMDLDALNAVKPKFEAPGNIKDPVKIAAAIAEKEAEWREKAALSPITGQVVLIGYAEGDKFTSVAGDEPSILQDFWAQWTKKDSWFCGWNIKGFDIPFLVRRSWIHGVKVPPDVFDGRYYSRRIVDLMEKWGCYQYGQNAALDTVAKAMGLGGKAGTGADFGHLWATDKKAAVEYCRKDVELVAMLARRMGVVP